MEYVRYTVTLCARVRACVCARVYVILRQTAYLKLFVKKVWKLNMRYLTNYMQVGFITMTFLSHLQIDDQERKYIKL